MCDGVEKCTIFTLENYSIKTNMNKCVRLKIMAKMLPIIRLDWNKESRQQTTKPNTFKHSSMS